VGYPPNSAKYCMIKGVNRQNFSVINSGTDQMAFEGLMVPKKGQIGEYLVGNFSELIEPGTYYIRIGEKKSSTFKISSKVYDDALNKCLKYFSIQRCGPSTTGYASPCHIDDGRRLDTGPGWSMEPHLDVSGGWHDAGDYRKWVGTSLYVMIALNKVADILGPDWNSALILEELKWGNRYILNMQNRNGYVMNYCGGNDGMYLTDNIVGTSDDRPIHTEPASFTFNHLSRIPQYDFIQAQALTAQMFKLNDPEYAQKCLDAAIRCYEWCYQNYLANTTLEMGAALMACLELHKATGDKQYLEEVIVFANRIMDNQVVEAIDAQYGIKGFFKKSSRDPEPLKSGSEGPLQIMALCMLYEGMSEHPDAQKWKESIRIYYEDYVLKLAHLHVFQLAPWGLYLSEDPGGNNKMGNYWIRYLSVTEGGVYAGGINPKAAPAGIGMLHASRILKNDALNTIAQRQLDWILGLNPLNMSTVESVGHNQPIRFINTDLDIPPVIPGAVMNGIGGTRNEQVHCDPGSWQNCEYWNPPTASTMWILAELQHRFK